MRHLLIANKYMGKQQATPKPKAKTKSDAMPHLKMTQ